MWGWEYVHINHLLYPIYIHIEKRTPLIYLLKNISVLEKEIQKNEGLYQECKANIFSSISERIIPKFSR